MEELQVLVEMVAKLPQMALWVLIGLWAYKVVVIGSIYGVIRFVVGKAHDYLVQKKLQVVEIRPLVDGMVIKGQLEPMLAQIRRVAGKGVGIDSQYCHSQSVDWLREAIDDKELKDSAKGK